MEQMKPTVPNTRIGGKLLTGSSFTLSKAVYDTETGKIAIVEEVSVGSLNEDGHAKGKILEGDIIRALTIDGKRIEITRKYQVIENMFAARVGSTVVFDIERNGQATTVTFTITEAMVTLM